MLQQKLGTKVSRAKLPKLESLGKKLESLGNAARLTAASAFSQPLFERLWLVCVAYIRRGHRTNCK